MADRLSMSLRSYKNIESEETKLDVERLDRIAGILETSLQELLKPEGYYIHQEIKDSGSGPGVNFGNDNVYNYGIQKELVDQLPEAKEGKIHLLKEEVRYLKEKIDQLLKAMGKKSE
jgi:transcriptional regulator with XRE-family HTH domain